MIYIRAKIEAENQTEEMELKIRDAILHAIKNIPAVNYAKVEVVLPSVTPSTTQSDPAPELTISTTKSDGIDMKSEINYARDRAIAMTWWHCDLIDKERERLSIIYGKQPVTGREIEMIWRYEMAKKI